MMDALFGRWRSALGPDFTAYRNHACRVFHLASALSGAGGEELEQLAVAAAFHDIGIWLDDTFDYLEPSIERAFRYLEETGRASWAGPVRDMIAEHHKVFPWHGPGRSLVEAFRRADWLDVSRFVLPTRLPRSFLRELVAAFPWAGFHLRLVTLTLAWTRRHPLRPLPMLKL